MRVAHDNHPDAIYRSVSDGVSAVDTQSEIRIHSTMSESLHDLL